jgi:signal transduction histidine kinase
MRNALLWKILAINIPVVAAVIFVMWLTIDYLAADYFSELMERYNISPAMSHQMFLDAIHRYLIQATVGAVVLAGLLAFLLTRMTLRPLSEMAAATRELAAGDYTVRVSAKSDDEIGRLGQAFNEMADSLERLEQIRRSTVSNVAHELRTPLATVRGYLEGLTDGVLPPSQDTFEMLQQEIMRLVRLVEDLHLLTQAEAFRLRLEREPIAFAALVELVLDWNCAEFETRNIKVEADLPDSLPAVAGNRDRLVQVLRNLIQNAWQHTPAGGVLRIVMEQTEGGVRATFSNTAEALGDGEIEHLFERFYRSDKSRSRETGGAGIGLALVKELIEAHGGSVGTHYEDEEISFWIELPV